MKKFKKIYIEITNVCNLKCTFCPTTNRKSKFIGIDEFTFVLDSIKGFTDYIYLHVKGEPLLHPNLGQLLCIAYEKGFKVNLTTNGTLISKRKDILISSPGLRQINVSLHSFDGNEDKGDKDEYLDNILGFVEEAKDLSSLIISLRLWNLNSAESHIRSKNQYIIEKLESKLNFDYNLFKESQIKRGIKIRDRLYLNEDEEFIWPNLNNDIYNINGFCYGLRDQIGILVDGTVIPCCLDGEGIIKLGNIFKENLNSILKKDRAKNIFDKFSNRKISEELCKHCGYIKKFESSNNS